MLSFLRPLLLCLLAFQASWPALAQRLPAGLVSVRSVEGVDEYRLDNGLQVLLIPDDSKPSTTVNLTYRVGSRHENYGETGMAHLLEHMLFKGTPTHRNVWAEFEKRGLAANGSTSYDRTNYTAHFSANPDNLQWYLGWLADAMVNSFIARKDLDTEMTVVRNEMERGENSPDGVLLRETMATMFDWHNYGKSTIGARSDVENVDIPRLQAFYRTYYQPDNATLIVAGRFDVGAVLQRIADTFGRLPKPTRQLPDLYTLDRAQDGPREVTVRRTGGTPLLYAGYHVPAGPAPEFAAVELLALILGEAPSGRLHKRLTEQRLASSTFAFAWALHDPSVIITGAQLAPNQDIGKARSALLAVNESLARDPITGDELERAKAKWAKSWEQNFLNPDAVGIALSESVAQGDWRLYFLVRDRVRDISLADVQRVADRYLLESNRTIGTYLPVEAPARAPAPERVDIAETMKDFKAQAAAATAEAFDATPANLDARTQRFAVGGIKVAALPKGTRGGAVRAVLNLRFGDEKSLFGLGEVPESVAALLDKGTSTMTREQIQDRLDRLKTELSISGGAGRVSIVLATRREYLADAMALVGDLLRHPTFPQAALDELKQQSLAAIEKRRKEPGALTQNTLDRWGNPYARGDVRYVPTFDEMVEDVNALNVDKLRDFHARYYGAGQGEFAAVGDLDPDTIRTTLQSVFAGWQSGTPFTRVPQPLVPIKPTRVLIETPDKQNATLRVREPLPISDRDPDYAALMMANHLLGGGGNSRLWKRIREAEGLSYDVRAGIGWSSFEPNSPWQASAIYAPQVRAKVEAALREEIARALEKGFTEQELTAGQRGLLSFRRLSRAQDSSLAAALANNLYLDRTFAYSGQIDEALEALTLEQVNAALRKYIHPDDFAFAFAGDFRGASSVGGSDVPQAPTPGAAAAPRPVGRPAVMEALVTPAKRFRDLPGYPWPVHAWRSEATAGLSLAYLDEGPRDAQRTFLCLHGNPSWSFLYRKMIPVFLGSNARVVAPDLLGFGRSDKPAHEADHSFDWHRTSLLAFVEALDLRHLTLVVQDWGGLFGLTLPMALPDHFDRLLLMNTGFGTGEVTEGFQAWRAFSNSRPDLDVGALFRRSEPTLSELEIAAYDAPFPDVRYKAALRAFPNLVPDAADAPGAQLSRQAMAWFRQAWRGESFMAIGMKDPVMGEPAMLSLRQAIPGCPEPLRIAEGGHFVQEHGELIARAALAQWAGR